MHEHPAVSALKIGLLAMILLALIFHFVGINETQTKVIETATRVDAMKETFGDLERSLADESREIQNRLNEIGKQISRGVVVKGTAPGSSENPPPANTDFAGYTEIFEHEPDPPRPPDDQIDFNAQLRLQLPSEPAGLNIYTSDRDHTVATRLGYYIYGPLGERHNANKDRYKAGFAESCLLSPDRRTFIIKLRKGVYWHRPAVDLTNPKYAWMRKRHEVTAEDLVFALDMLLDERADTDSIRTNFKDIVSYEALDPHTLRVTWKKANFYARPTLLDDLKAIPKWIFAHEEDGTPIDKANLGPRFAAHWFSKSMCGYGPYRFKEYKISDYFLFERNEKYWGRRPGFKTIFYKIKVFQDEPRYNMFMKRDGKGRREQDLYAISSARYKTDLLENRDSALAKELREKKCYLWTYQRKMFAYTGWACKSKFFDDPRVRRAMTMCANRDLWQKEILIDHAIFPTGVAFPPTKDYDHNVQALPYDLQEAGRLLDEAGWKDDDDNGVREKMIDGQKVEFRFKHITTEPQPAIGAMQDDWRNALKKIGVFMKPDVMVFGQLLSRLRDRDFDSISLAWMHSDDWRPSEIWHSKLIDTPGSYNHVQFSHPRIDEICDALETEFDLEKRYRLAHEFHRLFYEAQPLTISWSWRNPVLYESHIGGIFARTFLPQIDWRHTWWQKDGPAATPDDRTSIPR